MIKILNGYAGIGGNRRLWKNVEVTAIENNPEIANIYKTLYPNDTILIEDAHEYLLENYNKYDLVWMSPPCPSHSRMRQFVGVNAKGYKAIYPDMKLYEEIIFLQYNCKSKWVVENVQPYYEPLIKPNAKIGRHVFWCNFPIKEFKVEAEGLRTKNKISQIEELHDLDLSEFKILNKRQILRNCVNSEIGNHILVSANLSDK